MVISTKYILLLAVIMGLSSCNVLNRKVADLNNTKKLSYYSEIVTCHDCTTVQLTVLSGPYIIYFPCNGTTPYCNKVDPPIYVDDVVAIFAECGSNVPQQCIGSLQESALHSSSDD